VLESDKEQEQGHGWIPISAT